MSASKPELAGEHPNIVFIHAESMDGRKMGCMGHPAMQRATPHLDSLAEDGVLFTNAYTNCPVCNPSRASMWSGKYPHFYQCWNNHEGLHEDVPTYQNTMERAGYNFNAIGPLDYRWGMHSIRDQAGSWTRSANIHRPISRTPMPQIAEDQRFNGGDWERTHQSIAWLRDAAKSARPFMLYLTTGLVHPAFNVAREHMDLIDEAAIDMPPGLRPVADEPHPVDRYIRTTKHCEQQWSERMVREIRHCYFGMIAALDEMVGEVLGALDELGLRESTYVIFSSDHGEMAGEHNQILKRTMYEPSVHEPLIISGPGVQKGATVDTPVSLIDIYPTLMDMGRLDYADFTAHPGYPETLDGESLMPQLTGDTPRKRDWAFCEYNGDRCNTGAFMLRRGPWKYIKYIGYDPQLFHLEDDPWEMTDLAAARPEVVEELDAVMTANFDCEEIDAAAKRYDRETFVAWREEQKKLGTYEETMALVYSGFDRMCIEDIVPWSAEDERQIEEWLGE